MPRIAAYISAHAAGFQTLSTLAPRVFDVHKGEGNKVGTMNQLAGEITLQLKAEGTIFQITKGTDDLSEFQGRIGMYIASEHFGSSMKVYFDNAQSIDHLVQMLSRARAAIKTMGV